MKWLNDYRMRLPFGSELRAELVFVGFVAVVVLTLVGSVATGGIVFLDDFEDGSATDGDPVTWSPVPGATGSFDVTDGDYVMTRPTDIEEMYSGVNQYTLADTSIRTQARLIGSSAWWFGLFARANLADGTVYVALLKNNSKLEIWLFGRSPSSSGMLASANIGIDPRAQDVLLRFDVIGNELSAWAWREGDPMPAEPQVTAVHSELATGIVGVGADLGSRYSDNEAIFRYVEVDEPVPPLVIDFNGDGIVDIKDLLRLIQSWGQDDPMVDIAPPPFGDGIVDAMDLELLMSYWEQSIDDATLIAHWALDDTEGIFAADSAGDNDAVVLGGIEWQPTSGQIDGALKLDGVSGYAITGAVLNPADGPFSIFTWINGGVPGQVVVSQQNAANWLAADAEGNLMTELKGAGRSAGPLFSEAVITDGQWHRIGFVWNGLNRTLYVDGVAVAVDTQPGLQGSQMGIHIGTGKAMESGTYFSGLIDDVRVYNRAVSP
jgi:hypothetical protein